MADRREYYKQYYSTHRDEKLQKYKDKHPVMGRKKVTTPTGVDAILSQTMYDPKTGVVAYKDSSKCAKGDNYLEVCIYGEPYFAHHVAWVHVYGKFPDRYIDHINGNKHDNRICNLREVNKRENALNKQVHRDGKLPGATKCMNGYIVTVQLYSGYKAYLGYYQDSKSASNAYFKYLLEHKLISWTFAEDIGVMREEIENTPLPVADIKFYQDSSRKPREYLGELSEEYLLEKARENA